MATQTRREEEKPGRSPWQAFQLVSVLGATVLLLLLVVALLLPEGTISALAGKAADTGTVNYVAAAAFDDAVTVTSTVTATVTSTLGTEGAVEAQPIVETEPLVETAIQELPTAAECSGCMHIWIIDRYERKGVGSGWRMTIAYPDGSKKTFLVPTGGDFYVPTWNPPPGVCGGTYQITLEVPEGWEAITPASVPVTLTGTEGKNKCAQVRFKVGLLPTLKVVKLDQVGPGGKPAGIPGWQMTVTDNAGITLVGQTDGLGEVYFALPHLGNWLVTEESKTGWQPVKPAVPYQLVAIGAPLPPATPTATPWIVEVRFVNKQIREGCIEILKKDSAGVPLNGWTMAVRRNDGTFPDKVGKTGSNGAGRALVCGLPMGDYTVTETVQSWFRADAKTGSSQTAVLTTPGATASLTFVNEPLGCIDGHKIDYLNRGLPGWEIAATNELTGDRYVTVTNALGYFYFPDMPFGPYIIEETIKERWSAVTDSKQEVNITAQGPKCVPVRFKNIRDSACLEVYKGDASDPNKASPIGYSGVAGIKITLRPAYGGTAIEAVTDGTGRAFFDNLVPGMYIVEETVTDPWVAVSSSRVGPFELGASEPCWPLNSKGPVVFMNRQKTMPKPVVKDPAPPCPSCGCRAWYVVRPGNTLSSIACWYGTSVNALMRANHIWNPNIIYVGQRLCIP